MLGKKINITDQAIDKVRYVDIPTHTKEENHFIQEQHKNYLEMLKENNDSNEVAYLLKDGKVTKLYGNQDTVSFYPGEKGQSYYLKVNLIQSLCYIIIQDNQVFIE